MKISKILDGVLEAVFPSNIYCISCGCLIDRDRHYSICDKCMGKIHWITGNSCRRCGKDLGEHFRGSTCYNCMIREHKFVRGISCMTYGLVERQMILDYKYNGKGYMGVKFGDILADKLGSDPLEVDVIVPVPIHKSRERKRGYNQTAIMARRLSQLTHIPVRVNGCTRVRQTTLLRSMNPLEREAAMEGAFAVSQNEKKHILGKKILLVDDIITTGATVDSCAGALLDAGADCVYLLTLASGGNRKPADIDN
ncbi:MAG: ComF family protein [Eubacterium sp.]|nr:ComF family protein [Candidatus Colimonas fimequi]